MKITVQKFGGTSLASPENRSKAIDKIIAAKEKGFSPVIVVSAMGRKGEPYATDTLIELVADIKTKINPRDLDMLISCGETVSAVIMATALNARGADAIALTGGQAGIITDNNHGNASVTKMYKGRLLHYIEKGCIPVVTGFQGLTEYGDTTTLGRGGSDITAVLLGHVLNAHQVEIYTDVDGIMTADPGAVNGAKIIKAINYNEIFQMADSGTKVIHPRAIEAAMVSELPIVIKNTFSDAPGTLIGRFEGDCAVRVSDSHTLLTGISHIHNRVQVIIDHREGNRCKDDGGLDDDLLNQLAALNISIDLINIFTDKKVFTVDDNDYDQVIKLLQQGKDDFSINRYCSKITIIGSRIRGVPGVMARVLKSLNQVPVKIYQTSDSHTTISVLVKTEDAKKAMMALHREFGL